MKVKRVTKNVCKLHTKRVRLNGVAQREKKYLLNCSVRMYQRIIKLWYRASQYSSHMFSCNKPMCLYKRQTHVSNYCKFQLSSDIDCIEKLVLLQCTLTLAKQSRHIAKLMSRYLDKVQDKNLLQ